MLDFDHICKRKTPSIAALITPGTTEGTQKVFFGTTEILIPVYDDIAAACTAHPAADVFINYASFRSAYDSSRIALEQPSIRTVVIIAEGVPEADTRRLIALAKKRGKWIIGPATVGGIQAGAFKIGDTAGTMDNIITCKLYRPGSVGVVSKSGGLSNELYNMLSRTTDGVFEGVAIGGDAFAGSTFLDHIMRFQGMDEVKMIVVLGEVGGVAEYDVANAVKTGKVTKPVVSWVSGTCAKMFKTEVQFGHAGARGGGAEKESADAKNQTMREAGIIVPDSFDTLDQVIASTFKKLLADGVVAVRADETPPDIPLDYQLAFRKGRVRRSTGIVSTICDDRGEEPLYYDTPISEFVSNGNVSVGEVIAALWFKRKLPRYATRFIEIVLVLAADHGPCVSGAHNTIVAARAGKDLVSCVCSGMLTIGPRFGGAIDDAARFFYDAVQDGITPLLFVNSMKQKGIRIPGIGHRIKSRGNLDKRVIMMKDYAQQNFPRQRHLNFALAVEEITLTKAANLVLNVDGCIAALFLDLMESCAAFSPEEIKEIVEIGYLNGLFILSRTIGLVGHALDQKRLKQPLYRHPWDDVMYIK
jgi:ATP citrate (pro-S)-lyase